MKKLLALILSIGMCFSSMLIVGCNDNSSNEDTNNGIGTSETNQPTLNDLCDLSNEKTQELAKKLKNAAVYSYSTDLQIVSERLRVVQARNMYNSDCEALKAAQNQRPVRVFNSETGQWEYQIDQKAIKKAEEQVEISYDLLGGAILNANVAIEGNTYGKVIEELENYTATTASIRIILLNSLQYYEKLPFGCLQYSQFRQYTTDMPGWVSDITKIVKDFCGIQL